jgi:hypothetical protein
MFFQTNKTGPCFVGLLTILRLNVFHSNSLYAGILSCQFSNVIFFKIHHKLLSNKYLQDVEILIFSLELSSKSEKKWIFLENIKSKSKK